MSQRKVPPIHPGEILQQEFLKPMGISQYRLAKETSVPPRRINEIVRGMRTISADTALRLSRYFGTLRNASGSTCKRAMISKSRKISSVIGSPPKCAYCRSPKDAFEIN